MLHRLRSRHRRRFQGCDHGTRNAILIDDPLGEVLRRRALLQPVRKDIAQCMTDQNAWVRVGSSGRDGRSANDRELCDLQIGIAFQVAFVLQNDGRDDRFLHALSVGKWVSASQLG
jgi:hypothetical protein